MGSNRKNKKCICLLFENYFLDRVFKKKICLARFMIKSTHINITSSVDNKCQMTSIALKTVGSSSELLEVEGLYLSFTGNNGAAIAVGAKERNPIADNSNTSKSVS